MGVHKMNNITKLAGLVAAVLTGNAYADQVILDDLIVNGSSCVGQDCVNGESFGFDTIRLKENNLRIKFQDTSTSASFPTNDWQITANDTSNGGANKFSIDDIDGGRTPFTIRAGAPSNSLFVDAGGKLGLGTATPVVDVHTKKGNTPTLRLEQDGSSGFTPQTWDVAGNETNFFIRDASNGSTLPFRIRPGAPTSSIDIASDGDIGIGTSSPDAALHVRGTSADTFLHIEEVNGTAAKRFLLKLTNNGATGFELKDSSLGKSWQIAQTSTGHLTLSAGGTGGSEMQIQTDGEVRIGPGGSLKWRVDPTGNVFATAFNPSSDKNLKRDFASIDSLEVLQKVSDLRIQSWSYKSDESGVKHVGPVAQDFRAAFGLGIDDKHIATVDADGVALAAIQGLYEIVKEKDQQIARLEAQIESIRLTQMRMNEALSLVLVDRAKGEITNAKYEIPLAAVVK